MTKITKDMIIADIINVDRGLAMILMQNGMRCVGCGAATNETLIEACAVHGLSPEKCDEMVDEMNTYLENN
jgi:hybrid cluster-associated redox disulfide protein